MKRSGLLVSLLALVLFSCTRDVDSIPQNGGSLEGNWRMSAVKNNATGFMHTKPGAITGDVDITFVAASTTHGFINGRTPTNQLAAEYEIGEVNVIRVPTIGHTDVVETSWGLDFLYNIPSADTYSIEGGRLKIHTEKKTLIFVKN